MVVPETVLDEVLENYEKELTEKSGKLQAAQKSLSKIAEVEEIAFDLGAAVDEYFERLTELKTHPAVRVLPYPDVSAKQLVEASYSDAKPFDSNGNGFKDFLIWNAIAGDIIASSGAADSEHLFVTFNTGDFGIKKGQSDDNGVFKLHDDLVSGLGDDHQKLTCYDELDSVLNHVVLPKLGGLSVEDAGDMADGIEDFVEEMISQHLTMASFYGIEGLAFSNDVTVSGYNEAENIEFGFYVFEDDYMVRISGSVECIFDGFMNKWDYFSGFADHGITGGEMWNDHVVNVEDEATVTFEILAIYDPQTSTFSGQNFNVTNEIDPGWHH